MSDAEGKERLKVMRQDRGYIKGGISRIKNFCNSEQFSQSAPALLHEMRVRLVTSLKQYDDINREILRLCPDDPDDYFATEEKYFTSIAAIDSALKNASDSTRTVGINSKPEGEFKRLPAINIQMFDGKNIADYYPFINMFKAVIHADEKLGLCEKLYYLRTFLCGEALDLIKNLTLTDESYTAALELLKNRYDNIPKIINYHINCLLDLPSFTKCTASNLRSIVTNVQLHLAALKNLKQPVKQCDVILVNILAKKVDIYTYRGFHLERNMKEVPTLCEFLEFLEKRATAMETMTEEGPAKVSKPEKSAPKPMSGLVSSKSSTCKYCTQSHKLYECAKFKMATEQARADFVKDKRLCIICLNEHKGKCLLRLKCATCNKKHNTLMHANAPNSATSDDSNNNNAVVTLSGTTHTKDILLPTAMVRLINKNGTFSYARALLDSGSQVSFVSEALANKVDCKILNSHQLIAGICNNAETINKKADIAVYSSINDFKIEVSCAVVRNITCQLPQQSFDIKKFNIPSYAKLADEKFNQTGEISLLLGCDVFFQVLQRESLPLTPSGPFLVNTSFGYVLAGSLPVPVHTCKISSANLCLTAQGNNFPNFISNAQERPCHEIDTTMSHFWECEKVPIIFKEGSTEHQLAEQVFMESVRLENKRFSVALPLKVEVENVQLGNSFSCALQRLYNLEKRFCKDSDLYKKYKKFIEEYIEQGHARYFDISNYNLNAGNVYFLPHHPVINPNSKTTPVRAVFDASMKSKNNLSLNDIMLNGAVVQSDLFDILTLFRTFEFVLLCDIKTMYRQILVDEKYCRLQNVLWRDSQHDPVRCIQLQTVTYGLKSSAFLATRCLIELAHKYKERYPAAAFALQHSSYVDDIQCGSNDICELTKIKQELIELMDKASFSLHKWCSNHKDILKDIPFESQHLGDRDFDKNNVYVKTLGLTYDVASDTLNIKCPEKDVQEKYTKRQMLSFISKFFDPLGLVGPILVQAKYLMQQVWFNNISWDDELPPSLNKKWVDFAQSLVQMSCISIPRNINVQSSSFIEIVGFADASNIAYGCCLYLRVIDTNKNVKVNLLCSRSRINPKNKILTVPRLELNSALLLAMLAKKVYNTFSLKYNVKVFLYLDSKIALSWLKIEPIKLSVYVANRVNKIRELTTDFQWSYVKTLDNPADCLSRGVDPQSLEGSLLWWHGPQYLQNSNYIHCKFQNNEKLNDDVLELQSVPMSCNPCNQANSLHEFCEKYSSIDKMTRIMSYIKRFIFNCRKENVNKKSGNLCPEELESALHTLIKIEQSKYLETEIKNLLSSTPIKTNLNSLNPFLDTFGLLRVGGRLQNANLPFSKRHPIIIPKGSAVSKLIILKEHLRLKHAGQKLILSVLNEQYWLINANREIKSAIHKCVICFKLKAKTTTQLMGSLPIDRVNITRPFQIVGTDYGGPFRVKQIRVRNPVITKAYIVIFVCFVTKAIHIELASDMTTKTFLGCLKRFIARRNKPSKIYCDNGSCYKGANNVLNGLFEMHNAAHRDTVINYCSTERITFHFIPSYSPVFGGLWEAGIKSVKYHLKRVIGDSVLTYEELYTVLVQVESILNSRPLTPMSRDPDDMSYLTPGHFLTGSPLTSYPELNVVGENIGKLSFWKQCVKMQQHFWDQWHKQYLVMLQNRPKWKSEKPNLEKGTLVLLRDNNVAPLNWPMGRIVEVMPGKDGKVRAIQVKTTKGTVITTSLMKVCPLPIDYS